MQVKVSLVKESRPKALISHGMHASAVAFALREALQLIIRRESQLVSWDVEI